MKKEIIQNNYKQINYRYLLKSIYLKLYTYGYNEISLREPELSKYVEQIEKKFEKYNIYSDDLFVKLPVMEIYNKYKDYLIDIFVNNGIGHFNNRYDSIVIKTNPYYINMQLENMSCYRELIDECCNVYLDHDAIFNNKVKKKSI